MLRSYVNLAINADYTFFKKVYIILLFSLLLFIPNLHTQSTGFQFPPGKKVMEIPFEYKNSFIILNITFNKIFPLKFIFDTGAEHTILTKKEIVRLMRIPYARTFTVLGADMKTELTAHLVRGIHLKTEDVFCKSQDILVLDDDYFRFEEFTGTEIHGIIGADLFKRYVVKINYVQRVITLYKPDSFVAPYEGYAKIEFNKIKNKPYINTSLVLQNDTTLNTKLLIDTGASLTLLLNTFTHPQMNLPENIVKANIGSGLGGFLEGYKGRVKSLQFGDSQIDNIITNFQDFTEVEIDTSHLNGRNGLIGNDILSRFTIILDYQRESMHIKPNKNIKKKFKYDRSGLTLIVAGTYLDNFIVYDILENSPAYEAGIRKGDLIKNVNWLPTKLLSLSSIIEKLEKKVGKKIRMKIKRKGKNIKYSFHLRDLI